MLDQLMHNGLRYVVAKCQVCTFKGLLLYKQTIPRIDISQMTYDAGAEAKERVQHLCITCFETPIGCVSENARHKRLPEAEYDR